MLQRKKQEVEKNFKSKTLMEYLEKALQMFDKKSDQEKKTIIQSIIPEIIVHSDNRLELKVNSDPNGVAGWNHPHPRVAGASQRTNS